MTYGEGLKTNAVNSTMMTRLLLLLWHEPEMLLLLLWHEPQMQPQGSKCPIERKGRNSTRADVDAVANGLHRMR